MLKNRKGSALVSVIIIFSVLLTLCIPLGTSIITEAKQSVRQEKRTQAYYIARSGAAAYAKSLISMTPEESARFNALTFPLHTDPQSFGGGTFKITITEDSNHLYIESQGKVANGTNADGSVKYDTDAVSLVLNKVKSSIPVIDTAVYGLDQVSIEADVTGNIGTNSTKANAVTYGWGTIIGTVNIPVGGDPNIIVTGPSGKRPPVSATGSIRNYPIPVMPDFPEGLPNMGSISIRNTPGSPISGSGYYDSITISRNATLTIDTGSDDTVIRIGTLNVLQGNINVRGTGKLMLYVDECVTFKGFLNQNGDRNKVILYCNNEGSLSLLNETQFNCSLYLGTADLYMDNSGSVKGDIITGGNKVTITGGSESELKVLYAPNAEVLIDRGGTVYGAVIGKKVSVTGGGEVVMTEGSLEIVHPVETGEASSGRYTHGYWK